MEETGALAIVQDAVGELATNAAAVIPAALGVAILVFGAIFLWNTVKRLVS